MTAWEDLSSAERAAYSNGVGPWWFPGWPRHALTRLSAQFFNEADWAHHDYGYATRAAPRRVCDLRFLQAMLRDASQLQHADRMLAAVALAIVFWALVRAFGWASYGRLP